MLPMIVVMVIFFDWKRNLSFSHTRDSHREGISGSADDCWAVPSGCDRTPRLPVPGVCVCVCVHLEEREVLTYLKEDGVVVEGS